MTASPLFQPAQNYNIAGNAIVAADLNQDGRLDLVIAASNHQDTGAVEVLLGNPNGTFRPAATWLVAQP
jgi:hypothetical protein